MYVKLSELAYYWRYVLGMNSFLKWLFNTHKRLKNQMSTHTHFVIIDEKTDEILTVFVVEMLLCATDSVCFLNSKNVRISWQ